MKLSSMLTIICLIYITSNINGQQLYINEDFNSGSLPVNWTTSAITGTNTWLFGIDGSGDHPNNQNLDGSNFAYFDDSFLGGTSTNDHTYLETPAFNNSSAISTFLEFEYNFRHFGNTVPDSFNVQVFDGTNWNIVFSRTTDDCGNYLAPSCSNSFPKAKVDISNYANTNCKIRFIYFDGNDWGWYVGLDNVQVYSPLANDIGIYQIDSPQSGCGLSSVDSITVQIVNYGSSTQNNFPISYSINNGISVNENVPKTLNPNDTISYTFITTANFSTPGLYEIKAYSNLATDSAYINDTASKTVESILTARPTYNESFELNNAGWSAYGSSSSWSIGVPNAPNINTATHGTKIAATNHNGNYNNGEFSYLESPCFDFSNGLGDPILLFSLNYITEPVFDRFWVEFSVNSGSSWTKLNTSVNAQNWYNDSNINAWTGNSNGWLNVENVLLGLNNQSQVKLRFVFESDGSTQSEGIGIDNFLIRFPQAIDLAINEISYPSTLNSPECGFNSEPIIIQVENKGADTINSYNIHYRVDGGNVVSETINSPLPSNTVISHTFTQNYNFSTVKNYQIDAWVNAINDSIKQNDSINNLTISNTTIPSQNLPFNQDFDNWQAGTVFSNTNDAIGLGWSRASTNPGTNPYLWRVGGSTANRSGGTGPDGDQNTGGNGGYFMYTEASGNGNGAIATLTSPCIDLSQVQGAKMSFWWHRYGSQINSPIRLDIYDGTQWILDIANGRVSGPNQNSGSDPWQLKKVDLSAFIGRNIKVRFSATSAGCCSGDMAVDNIKIWEPLPQDAQVNFVDRPVNGCNLNSGNIRVNIENFGTQTIAANRLQLSYKLNGGAVVTETVPFSINANDTAYFTFSTAISLLNSGSQNLSVWSNLQGDSNSLNDSTTYSFTNRTIQLPRYFYDFENMSTSNPQNEDGVNDFLDGWSRSPSANGNNFTWMVGEKEAPYTNINIGGVPFVVTGPSGDHTNSNSLGNGEGKYIFTNTNIVDPTTNWPEATIELPCSPIDFSSSVNGKVLLSFWYHIFGNNTADLFIDVHNGTQWVLGVGVVSGQGSISQPTPQSEDTDLWLKHLVELDQFSSGSNANNIRIRFRAQYSKDPANGSNARGGDIAIDDIEIIDRIAKDGGISQINSPLSGCSKGSSEQLNVEVLNFGTTDITQLNLAYQYTFIPLNGGSRITSAIIREQATGILILPMARSNYTFVQSINMLNSGTYSIKVWTEQQGDTNSFNDTITKLVKHETRPFPYIEDWSGLNSGDVSRDFLNETFPNDWVGTNNNYNWAATRRNPGTLFPSAGSTTGLLDDIYMAINNFNGFPGQVASLTSPCIDLTSATNVIADFNYVINGNSATMLIIDARPNFGGWFDGIDTIFRATTSLPNWINHKVDLSRFAGNLVNVRIRGIYGSVTPGVGGCYAIDDFSVVPGTVGVEEEIELLNVLAIFPNPSDGQFNLNLLNDDLIGERLQIFNSSGQLVKEERINNRNHQIDLKTYSKGIYFLSIQTKDKRLTKKLLLR